MTKEVEGLDDPCPVCERTAGDHTMREWAVCLGAIPDDRPYADAIGTRLGLPPGHIIADSVEVQAAYMTSDKGGLDIRVPVLIHHFRSSATGTYKEVATVAFIAPYEGMRKYGKLVRDSANGAANRAERRGAPPR